MVAPPAVHAEVRALKERGDEAYASRDYAKAAECYSEALEEVQDVVVLSNRSASYSQRRRFDKALVDADKALKMEPCWARLYHRRGHALFHLGCLNEAVLAFERGLELEPEEPSLKEALRQALEYTEPGQGFFVATPPEPETQGEDQPHQPGQQSEGATDTQPQQQRPMRAGAFSKASQARAAAGRGAGNSTKAATSSSTKSAEELREQGNVLFRQGKHSKAVRVYDEAIRADSSDARSWSNRAAAQMAMLLEFGKGLSPEAMRSNPYFANSMNDLTESLSIDPQYVKAWARKGQLHGMAGEVRQALDAYNRGLAIDPNSADCLAGRKAFEQRL
eukprot:TRINITY_DN97809_c0_g1_i1.p1 TRINITY_DN97809_c0_g1~~TRINITY_DN97809_c0_g1_i1.p1  ORF type:complete len:334 (-),score=80.05 TRINITY_DN97809_c0_g1_i1:96-1097(-)